VIAAAAGASSVADRLRVVADGSTVHLTTVGRKSGQPRTVTIWYVVDAGAVYVQSGKGGKTDWYRNVKAKPEVTLDFGELRVVGRATPIADENEARRVRELFRQKYWLAWMASWVGAGFGQGAVVRIEPSDTTV
jgi:deazaflavin-dependent oxidoreductase (nitroreductase family)